jgi:hypothetical protein
MSFLAIVSPSGVKEISGGDGALALILSDIRQEMSSGQQKCEWKRHDSIWQNECGCAGGHTKRVAREPRHKRDWTQSPAQRLIAWSQFREESWNRKSWRLHLPINGRF